MKFLMKMDLELENVTMIRIELHLLLARKKVLSIRSLKELKKLE